MENFNEGGRDTLSIPIPFAVSPRSPVYKTRGINQARVVEDVGRRTQDSWEFLVGCVARFSCKILFQTWHLSNYVIITQIRTATKTISQIPFRIRIFLFFSYSFGIKTINTFIHYRNQLQKTIPDSRPKWVKSTPVFRPKRPKHHTLWLRGGTYSYALYKGVPPMGLSSDRYRKMYRFAVHVLRENLKFGHFTSRLYREGKVNTFHRTKACTCRQSCSYLLFVAAFALKKYQ